MVRRLAWFVVVVGLVVACGSSAELSASSSTADGGTGTTATACIPGEQRACACPGGAQGAQVCSADGMALGACTCPGAGGSGGTGHGGASAGGGAPGGAGGAGTGGATSTGGAGGTVTGSGGSGGAPTTETAAGGAGGSGGSAATDAGAPDASSVPYAPDFTGPYAHGLCSHDGGALTVDCNGDGKCEAAIPADTDCGLCAPLLVCPPGFQCQTSILTEWDAKTEVTSTWAAWCKPL